MAYRPPAACCYRRDERSVIQRGQLPGDAASNAYRLASIDALIVDPPRRGLGPTLVDAIRTNPPARLVYVSCGLAAFVREASVWLDAGALELRALSGYALFPYTEHVETLGVFARP